MANLFLTQTYKVGPLSAMQLVPSANERETEIFRKLIYDHSLIQLQEFDYLVTKMIPSVLEGIYYDELYKYEVTDVLVKFPTHTEKINDETKKLILTPYLASMLKCDYVCAVHCTVTKTKKTEQSGVTSNKFLGYIPCMVGSSRCVTGIKPDDVETLDEWKLTLGEGLPAGYFIRNGVKVALLSTIKQSTHTVFTTKNKKDRITTRITNVEKGRTTVLRIKNGKDVPTIEVKCPHIGDEGHYTIFFVFYALYYGNEKEFSINKIVNLICSFAAPEEIPYIVAYLDTSITVFRFKSEKVEFDDEGNEIRKLSKTLVYSYMLKKLNKKSKKTFTNKIIHDKIADDVFPIEKTIGNKIINLAHLVCRHVKCCVGLRAFENEDHGDKKKLDNFSRMIEHSVIKFLQKAIVTNTPEAKKWLIGIGDKEENMVETLKVESFSLIKSTMDKVNVKADKNNKSSELRRVHPTCQFGLCPASTSEGKICGMTGNICVCTRISWNSEYIETIIPLIKTLKTDNLYIVFKKQEGYKLITIIEGENEKQNLKAFLDEKMDGSVKIYCSEKFISIFRKTLVQKRISEDVFRIEETENEVIFHALRTEKRSNTQIYNGYYLITTCSKEVKFVFKYCFNILNDYCSSKKQKGYDYTFSYNSSIMCLEEDATPLIPTILWFNPQLIYKKIKKYIRSGRLPIDTCVFINNTDKEVKYLYDSGRMMFPALVCDDDGNLILDNIDDGNYLKDNWSHVNPLDYSPEDDRIKTMFSRGIMEYVDLKNFGNVFQAEDLQECRNFSKLRHILNSLNIKDSDSYFFKNGEYYHTEDMSYVVINGKKYELKFLNLRNKEVGNQLEKTILFDRRSFKVYGCYSVPTTKYVLQKDVIIVKKPKNCTIRDGAHLAILKNNTLSWINAQISGLQTEYNGERILEFYFRDSEEKQIVVKKFEEKVYITEVNFKFVRNMEKRFFSIEEDEIVWYDSEINSNGDFNFQIDFEGFEEGFFAEEPSEYIFPVTEDMKYEKFNFELEEKKFDDIVKLDASNDRECDFLMTFRRNQKYLNFIDINRLDDFEHINDVILMLQTNYQQFRKKSNIYKIFRYLNWRFKFTHCPLDPGLMYSAVANLSIKANHDQGPRFTYQFQMSKQAESITNPIYFTSFDCVKQAIEIEQQIVEAVASEPLCNVTMASSMNYIVGTVTNIDNFEDALTVAKSVVFRYRKPYSETYEEDSKGNKFISFPKNEDGNKKDGIRVRNLDENGLPKLGSIMEYQDTIIGIMKENVANKERRDVSPKVDFSDDGRVSQMRVFCGLDSSKKTVEVKIIRQSESEPGDKFAGIHAQKGTIAKIYKDPNTKGSKISIPGVYGEGGDFSFLSDVVGDDVVKAVADGTLKYKIVDDDYMPTVCGGKNDGMKIQVLFSPFSYPTRMTLGMNYEKMAAKAGVILQRKFDGTNHHPNEIEFFEQILEDNGYDRQGCEFLKHNDGELIMDVTTGKPLRCYVCPCGYKKLKHDVPDKISVRYIHKRDPFTGQPKQGRKKKGGQRFGDMEKDVLYSHGTANIVLDRMLYASDVHKVIFCKHCGNASSNSNILKRVCKICNMTDSLCVFTQSRISRIVAQYLEAAGIVIKYLKKKEKTIVDNLAI